MKINRTFNLINLPLKKGFTLIELMIVIAIVAILATIAVPSYQNYTKKAAVSELLQATAAYRADIELCIYNTNDVRSCNAGSNGIRSAMNESGKYIKSVTVNSGVISAQGRGALDGVSYSLTATGNANTGVSWTVDCNDNQDIFPVGFCS
ncbi:prepilin peptidase dependent protein D [Mesocricetibacter intestinalis]|uniref:Prepilin peptidase dependent protein D n=1 Tax=Mesocricetibacter intestinalis TaxID=1521930 RepID=A0A4R6VIF0_9PAST|nr:prepilin peptidase-dependent pilin [Mesocricetibacter intestinalis]TDQ58144.1 prepilin peptidase dependent protein D [Mesocricetibacter intestinalis]